MFNEWQILSMKKTNADQPGILCAMNYKSHKREKEREKERERVREWVTERERERERGREREREKERETERDRVSVSFLIRSSTNKFIQLMFCFGCRSILFSQLYVK